MTSSTANYFWFALLGLWIILISVWASLDSIFVPDFGPLSIEFISQRQTQILLAIFLVLTIPIAIYLEWNVEDHLILSSVIVFLLIWLFSSGISYLSTVIGEHHETHWEAISAFIWGVMYFALIQLVAVFYLVFYLCIAFLFCYVLSEMMKKWMATRNGGS